MLSSDTQAVVDMVDVGKSSSALRSFNSAYFAQQGILGMKACEREKWVPLENWTIGHRYLKRMKPMFDNPSAVGNNVRRGIKFL